VKKKMESEWIKRYIHAVGKEFSEPQRSEIEKEIRLLIDDMLDARTADRSVTDEDIKAVLSELGNPELMADKYRDRKRYLIGPEIFPSYISILKLVGMALGIAMVVLFAMQVLITPDRILQVFVSTLTTALSAVMQGFAWVTLGFAVAERLRPADAKLDLDEPKEWKVSDLPELPETRYRIPRAEAIWSITFALIFGMIFTFGAHLLGAWFIVVGQPMMVVPVFDVQVFLSYLPYLWGLILFDIALEIGKYHYGRWTVLLAGVELINHICHLAVGLMMFSNPLIWNPNFMSQLAQAANFSSSTAAYESIQMVWYWFTTYTTYMVGLVYGINLLLDGLKIFRMTRRID
jgi:hypothetical protein